MNDKLMFDRYYCINSAKKKKKKISDPVVSHVAREITFANIKRADQLRSRAG